MRAEYDIFLSHAWADGDRPQQIADALTKAGLRVWLDASEINDFAGITRAVTEGLARSKTLLAYYSKTYPLRRACQWELTAAFLAAQTEGDPRRRVLVVNPEEKTDHIHPVELRDAKFRNAPTSDAEMRLLVEGIVKHIGAIDGALADIRPLTSPNWYGRTPVGSTRFVGRMKEMWEIHSLLHACDVAQVSYSTSATGGFGRVSGLGGIGKSLLVEEYALHYGAAFPGGIFWLQAFGNDDAKTVLGPDQREAVRVDQVRQIAERMGIDTRGFTDEQTEGALARKLGDQSRPCLWIVDDVPNGLDGEALRRWFAPHAVARTLISTRSGEYGSIIKGIDLSVLTPDEAWQLLTSRRTPAGGDEVEQARDLAKDLGYHALGLDVTASALTEYSDAKPFRKFRAELAHEDEDSLELANELSDTLPNGHEKSITQTVLKSIRRLGTDGLDFLRLASVLAVAPIPGSLVTSVFEKADGLDHDKAERRQRKAFHEVTKTSLAEVAGERQDARSVHTLVSRAVRFKEKSTAERTQALRSAAVIALTAIIAEAADDPRQHNQIEFHVTHARQVAAIPTTIYEADLIVFVAQHDSIRGAYGSARALLERAVAYRSRVEGPEHRNSLAAMSDLGILLQKLGDLGEARNLQGETLAIQRRVLGPEHPDTLQSMNNLAATMWAQGNFAGAQELQEETLAFRLQVLGLEHPDTLRAMNNLATTLGDQGDLDGERELQEETLAVRRRVLGLEHLDTLGSMNNLAVNLYRQGDLSRARKLQEEALATISRALGPEHPVALSLMSNLASTLAAQKDLAGARKLQERALAIKCRVLGHDHPNTLASMNNLAQDLRAQRDFAGARELQEELLTSCQRVLGADHPHTTLSAWNLYRTLEDMGERAAARDVLESDLKWLLARDPATLGSDQRKTRNQVADELEKGGSR